MVVPPERRTILYSGHVQGVGFRWTAARALEGLPVAGYVRNLRDGRVEIVLEGEAPDVEEGARRVRRSMAGHIEKESATPGPATGEFDGFRIARS